MELMVSFALNKGMHVISDEIYGLSTFPGEKVNSAADLMYAKHGEGGDNANFLTDYVHVVGGLSKDWGLSGMRVGACLSHNAQVNSGITNIAYFQMVSQLTQHILTGVLGDDKFVESYVMDNQRKLHEVYQEFHKSCESIGVPVVPSQGTLMAWADFSKYLIHFKSEKDMWLDLHNSSKILFTTGKSCHGEKPGMFRVCYAWPTVLESDKTQAMRVLGERLRVWDAKQKEKKPKPDLLYCQR